jgi:hypothetical protein
MTPSQYNNDALNFEIMAEEAAEVIKELSQLIQIKSKIVRFGIDDKHPIHAPNRNRLEEEIGHVKAMFEILEKRGVVNVENIEDARRAKLENMEKWYSKQ